MTQNVYDTPVGTKMHSKTEWVMENPETGNAEIGEVLGVPPGTVRSRIARGRAALADLLGNQETLSEHQTRQDP